jgi:hypothetical protein
LLVATSAVCVVVAAVAVSASTLTSDNRPSSAPAVGGVSGLVPWVDRPATPPPLPAAPTPAPPAYPACAAGQLQGRDGGVGFATGNAAQRITVTNTGKTDCSVSGLPASVTAVRANGTSLALPVRTGSMFDDQEDWPGDLRPGDTAGFAIVGTDNCSPSEYVNARDYVIGMPGGGDLRVAVASGDFCADGVTPLGVPAPPPPGSALYPGVAAEANMPAVVTAGDTVTYVVTLTNTTAQAVALDPCPVYTESIYSPVNKAGSVHSYYLNCDSVRSIPAHASVRYQMKIRAPDVASQGAKFDWNIPNSQNAAAGRVIKIEEASSTMSTDGCPAPTGSANAREAVPNLLGLNVAVACRVAARAGYGVVPKWLPSNRYPDHTIFAQEPTAGPAVTGISVIEVDAAYAGAHP